MLLLREINSEIGEIQSKLLSLQSRLLKAKQTIIKQEFEKDATFVNSEVDEEVPLPF